MNADDFILSIQPYDCTLLMEYEKRAELHNDPTLDSLPKREDLEGSFSTPEWAAVCTKKGGKVLGWAIISVGQAKHLPFLRNDLGRTVARGDEIGWLTCKVHPRYRSDIESQLIDYALERFAIDWGGKVRFIAVDQTQAGRFPRPSRFKPIFATSADKLSVRKKVALRYELRARRRA